MTPAAALKHFYNTRLRPETVDQSGGVPRIVFIDFLRGISIVVMLAFHEFFRLFHLPDPLPHIPAWLFGVLAPIAIPVAVLCALFMPFRGVFAYVSGASTAYGFFKQIDGKPVGQQLRYFLRFMLAQLVLLPVFCYLAWVAEYTILLSKSQVPFPYAGYHFWQVNIAKANPVLFFGVVNLVFIPLVFGISLLLRALRLRGKGLRYARSQICFVACHALVLANTEITRLVNGAAVRHFPDFLVPVKHQGRCMPKEFYSEFYNAQGSLGGALGVSIFSFIAGDYMPLFPYLAYVLAGASIGDQILILLERKQESPARSYQHYRLFRLNLLLQAVISAAMVVPNAMLMYYYIQKGTQQNWFYYFFVSVRCMTQELASFYILECIVCIVLSLLITDNCTPARAREKANRLLYIRMFSSYSLTCFALNAVLGLFARSFVWGGNEQWGQGESLTDYVGLFFYIIFFMLFVSVLAYALNGCGGCCTVENLLRVLSDLLRGRSSRPIADQHMSIKIVQLLENPRHRCKHEPVFETDIVCASSAEEGQESPLQQPAAPPNSLAE